MAENVPEKLDNPHFRVIRAVMPEAERDFHRAKDISQSNRKRTIEGKIERGTARPDQILEWYFSQDPLNEQHERLYIIRGGTGNDEAFERQLRRSQLYEKSSKLLMRSSGFLSEDGRLFTDDFSSRVANGELSFDELKTFTTALKMSSDAADHADLANILGHRESFRLSHRDQFRDIEEIVKNNLLFAMENSFSVSEGILNMSTTDDPRILSIGVESMIFSIALRNYGDERNPKELMREARNADLLNIIRAMNFVYLEKNILDTSSFNKGRLMEQIWFLDALFFLRLQDNYSMMVIPTTPYKDKPKIGYPELNRGIDMYILDAKRGIEFFLQLKSGSHVGRYHPTIVIAKETGFSDHQPERLAKKLTAYKRAIESGFGEGEVAEANEYLLASVRDILSDDIAPNLGEKFRETYGLSVSTGLSKQALAHYKPVVIHKPVK